MISIVVLRKCFFSKFPRFIFFFDDLWIVNFRSLFPADSVKVAHSHGRVIFKTYWEVTFLSLRYRAIPIATESFTFFHYSVKFREKESSCTLRHTMHEWFRSIFGGIRSTLQWPWQEGKIYSRFPLLYRVEERTASIGIQFNPIEKNKMEKLFIQEKRTQSFHFPFRFLATGIN